MIDTEWRDEGQGRGIPDERSDGGYAAKALTAVAQRDTIGGRKAPDALDGCLGLRAASVLFGMALDDTELPEHYRLSFLIGEICRRNVWVENELRRLAYAFDDSTVASPSWESDYGRMLPLLLTTVEQPSVPLPFRRLVAQIANIAIAENRNRNRFAHDLWIEIPRQESPVVGLSSRRGREEVALDEFRRCAAELARLVARARGLWVIAPSWIGPAADWQNADDLRSWTRVSMGHIAENPNAMRGTPGPCPEPPGGYVSIGPQ